MKNYPRYLLAPVIGCLVMLWILAGMNQFILIVGLIWIVIGIGTFFTKKT
ncbi:hypothetical protein [Piscirickettsia litoralis]|nr:hypothetical protein [Piscirickettsia litoralis]